MRMKLELRCRTLRRLASFSSAMSQLKRPTLPLLVVMGSTGTGKSELAVELATRFNGEIINADAMQMYRGLPIITNKITSEEQRHIPHHLLGEISLDEDTWTVGVFKREASKIIHEIRSRGHLPIVVGGTHYYLDGLLFEDHLIGEGDDLDFIPPQEVSAAYPVLDSPPEVLWEKLNEVDPVQAARFHPRDGRKLRRSLEIYLRTGKRASDIYAEQQERKTSKWISADDIASKTPFQSLMLWVYSKRDVLTARLDKRVDKMLENGLLAETTELFDYQQDKARAGQPIDLSKGIWQSIGYKQFLPYMVGVKDAIEPGDLEKLKQAAVESTKTATRQYAKNQLRWISRKTMSLLEAEHAMNRLFVLDSSDISQWADSVVEKASMLTGDFLAGEDLPDPVELSDTAKEVLLSSLTTTSAPQGTPCHKTCELCNVTTLTEELWTKHVLGRSHRARARRVKRRALVVVEQSEHDQAGEVEEEDSDIYPSTLFEPS